VLIFKAAATVGCDWLPLYMSVCLCNWVSHMHGRTQAEAAGTKNSRLDNAELYDLYSTILFT
jgi:hypothetical protein